MSERLFKCEKHGIEFNVLDGQCPACLADRSAYEFTLRAMTCGLCGELKASTVIMCGGAIGRLCEDCRALIKKWEEAKERRQKRLEEKRKRAEEEAALPKCKSDGECDFKLTISSGQRCKLVGECGDKVIGIVPNILRKERE